MFEAAVSFELDRIKGIKNLVFGGDGIFLAPLTGPGHVWLQTPPLPKLAGAAPRPPPAAGREQGRRVRQVDPRQLSRPVALLKHGPTCRGHRG